MNGMDELVKYIKSYVDSKDRNDVLEEELANRYKVYFIDTNASWAEFNRISNAGSDEKLIIVFRAGNYSLSSCKLKHGTHIICSKDAIFTTTGTLFLNFNNGDLNGQYSGNGDIVIDGGTVNGQLLMFSHAQNIHIKNVKMYNSTKQYIMLAACKNVHIEQCEFNGINNPDNEIECIELCGDNVSSFKYSSYAMYDGTPCCNIEVSHCTFNGDDTFKNKVCLGSHSNHYVHNNSTDKNISFHDNIVNYVSYNMVTASYYEGLNIYDNIIDASGKGGVCFLWKTSSRSVNIHDNTIKNVKSVFASNQPYFVLQDAIVIHSGTTLTPTFTQNLEVRYTLNNNKLIIKSTAEFIKIRTLTNINITNLFDITTELIGDKNYTVYTMKTNTTTTGEETILCVFAGIDKDVNPLMRNHSDIRIHNNNVYNVLGLMISSKRVREIFINNNHFENIQLPFKGWYTDYFEIKDNYLKNVTTDKRGFFTSYGGFECNVQDNIIDKYQGKYYEYAYWYITTVSDVDNFKVSPNNIAYKKICKNNQLLNGSSYVRAQLSYNTPVYNENDLFIVRSSQLNTSGNIDINVNLQQLDTIILSTGFVSQDSYGINTITIKSFGEFFNTGEKYIFNVATYDSSDTGFTTPIIKTGYIIINSISPPVLEIDEYNDSDTGIMPQTSSEASSNIFVYVPDNTQPIRKIYTGLKNKFRSM